MDPKQLFSDERFNDFCVFCGDDNPVTRDHIPSKVFLDIPYPSNLPVVSACMKCNQHFSLDEEYLACFIEVATVGSTEVSVINRENIKRIFRDKPALAIRINKSRYEDLFGGVSWNVEIERVENVILKLAKGHVAYALSEPRIEVPEYISWIPLNAMPKAQFNSFYKPSMQTSWSELGSRQFISQVKAFSDLVVYNKWHTVQEGRYSFMLLNDELLTVRMEIGGYLECEVSW